MKNKRFTQRTKLTTKVCQTDELPFYIVASSGLLSEYGQVQHSAETICKDEALRVWPETLFLPPDYGSQWTALELEVLVDFELIAMLKWNYKICRDSVICAICVHLFCSSI